ncbi:MAG: wax ester/triacylglycerol synthase family O-acyltransferase [Moraxella sp.]|nr:wax ester/triacylglycerol synthase family O-acyltransferase [Moraxella sp.]
MRALSVIDYLFLFLEAPKQPMHVAGLCIFEIPNHASKDFVKNLVRQIKDSGGKPTFPFNQKLHRRFFWQTDDNFDIHRHFRHVSLPTPSTDALLAYISQEHGRKLGRQQPLWEFHFIDKLEPEHASAPMRFAIWLKIHHAMTDGIAAMRLLQMSLSTCSEQHTTIPFWSLFAKHRNQLDALLPIGKPFLHIVKEQCQTICPVGKELLCGLRQRLSSQSYFVSTFDAPKSILNQRIGNTRHLSAHTFDKQRFANIAKAFDATTNDVILAVCAGALRQYLSNQNALPNKPLIAFVPVSLRRDDSAVGNQISFILTNLGTHLADAAARLSTIKNSIDDGKRRFLRMNQAQIINYSAITYAWAGINLATGLLPSHQAFNLIISNVPGSQQPLYLNGAKLTGIYPASVLFDGQALNITLANHQDKIDFGITACGTALPNIDSLGRLLCQALTDYERLLNKQKLPPKTHEPL